MTKPQLNLEVVEVRKLAGMICVQPPPDVCGIVKARCRPHHCRGLRGEGVGWPHAPPPVIEMDSNGNGNCDCLREKRGWTRGGERGN